MITREQAISHIHTRSECLNTHKTKRGKGMHPEQNERGSDSSGLSLELCDSIAFPVVSLVLD